MGLILQNLINELKRTRMTEELRRCTLIGINQMIRVSLNNGDISENESENLFAQVEMIIPAEELYDC